MLLYDVKNKKSDAYLSEAEAADWVLACERPVIGSLHNDAFLKCLELRDVLLCLMFNPITR